MKLKHSTHAAAASVVALSLSLLASLSAQQSRLEVAAAVGARSDNPPAEVQDEAARQTAEKRREIIPNGVLKMPGIQLSFTSHQKYQMQVVPMCMIRAVVKY